MILLQTWLGISILLGASWALAGLLLGKPSASARRVDSLVAAEASAELNANSSARQSA